MGENDGKSPETPTPQEQVAGQVAATDGVQGALSLMHKAFGFGQGRAFYVSTDLKEKLHVNGGASDFEEHRLNKMLELVENTKPSDLENAGSALWRASQAIADAATELRANLKHASDDFKGEAGTHFQDWGEKLAKHTDNLGTYVESAGVEIAAAASGLASVKSSLPPRDTRPAAKDLKPTELPAGKQKAGDADYDEAVKVEKHRQEAINQMNRLASFYSVSAESLGSLKPPTFEAMPNVGVPKPDPSVGWSDAGGSGGAIGASSHSVAVTSSGHEATHAPSVPDAQHSAPHDVRGSVSMPDHPVSTEINSVGTLPTPTTSTPGPQAPVSPTGPSAGGTSVPFPTTGFSGPLGQGAGRFGGSGGKAPFSAQGRASNPGSSGTSRGTTNNPMGRASSTGQAGQSGTSRGGMQGGRPTSTGRGVTGGTPRANATPGRASGPGTTGAARSNGVVGGRPSNTAKGGAQSGPRVSRGTVMGEGATGNARGAAGRISQRGVMGAPGTETNGRSTGAGRKIQGASEAVTGRPVGKGSAARAGRNGFTSGGEGLVRGPSTRRDRDEDDQEGSERPDYVVEDEATHLPKKQRPDVPPVID